MPGTRLFGLGERAASRGHGRLHGAPPRPDRRISDGREDPIRVGPGELSRRRVGGLNWIESVDQPASVGMIANDLLAGIVPRHELIDGPSEFNSQSGGFCISPRKGIFQTRPGRD